MTWRKTIVEQRNDFVRLYLENETSLSSLTREFGISRTTAYKWINRFNEEGEEGLKDRSRARHTQNAKTSDELVERILQVKKFYLKWGPKKILAFLENNDPSIQWPSLTTVGNILDENGLVIPRKYRKRLPAREEPLSHCLGPNDVWAIDFKGCFLTKDNVKCDPLTLTDAHSRFLLYCSKLCLNTADHVWKVLTEAFSEYGMPLYLRHDNGPPFATCGIGRLSRLSIQLIKAGVIPEWIDPGKPYQNGRHERMHLTLKEEGIFPLKLTLEEQQLKFQEFKQYYNFERPNEALGQKPPAFVYKPSERKWTGILKSPEYSDEYKKIRVRAGGQIGWKSGSLFIGKTLQDEYVGVKENEDGELEVYYGPVLIGIITDDNKLTYRTVKRRKETKFKQNFY